MEHRFMCCDSDISVKGCTMFECHVHDVMRNSELGRFIRTPKPTSGNDLRSRRVYAMDCEMVYTVWGMAVARVTVVDTNDAMVLDQLIKPAERILDYNTKFSGLTKEIMEKADVNLEQARRQLFNLVNSETILIGHSLESDLRAMRLIHKRVVDTSVVWPHKKGPPYKRALRNLASEVCKRIIQESTDGHDSKEDSSACLQLMQHKVREDLTVRRRS